MLAQLEVKKKEIPGLSRTSTDFQGLSSPGMFFLIQGLTRIFKACGHPATSRRARNFPCKCMQLPGFTWESYCSASSHKYIYK
jgi:hypothetical protein